MLDPPVTRINFRFKVIPVCSQSTNTPAVTEQITAVAADLRLSHTARPLLLCDRACAVSVATIGLAYLQADLALNECRREQVKLGFQEDMRARSAAWTARKNAAQKVAAATEAAQHPQPPHRGSLATVLPTTEDPTSPSAIGAAQHDGTYSRSTSHALADAKSDKK